MTVFTIDPRDSAQQICGNVSGNINRINTLTEQMHKYKIVYTNLSHLLS
jgi:hypothetical protein